MVKLVKNGEAYVTRKVTSKSNEAEVSPGHTSRQGYPTSAGTSLWTELAPLDVLTGVQPAPIPGVRPSPQPGFARGLLGGMIAEEVTLTSEEAEAEAEFEDYL